MGDLSHNGQNVPSFIYSTHPAQAAKISLIATPLGNLQDLSPRAREALSRVDELWCEDTRHTQALLSALQTPRTPVLRRFDQHTDPRDIERWLEVVEERRQWIGVVTDAGTPGVSDPGGVLVRQLTQKVGPPRSIRLEVIPGPSAVSALTSVAGFEENSFVFMGFLPRSESEIHELLDQMTAAPVSRNWIFFESPHRIEASVQALANWKLGQEAQAEFVLAKELTKLHETLIRGSGPVLWNALKTGTWDWRGEWCLAVILPKSYVIQKKTESDWELALTCLIQAKIGPKEASSLIVQHFSVAKNLAYRSAIEIQKKMQQSNSNA